MASGTDKELEEYRRIMTPPSQFEEGFGFRTILGALFLGFVMMPASMYMGLVTGPTSIGDAARWVTVILFLEIAKRSQVTLKAQELFVLYYMAGMAIASPFDQLLFRQYMVVSPAAEELHLVGQFPEWVAPSKAQLEADGRNFFTAAWVAPIGLIVLSSVLARIDHFGLGYFLYRLTSDVEKLPFPMAPVGAAGAMALAESAQEKQSWRWRTFSIGTMIGLSFGAIYAALPAITGAVLGTPIKIIPLPFIELTDKTADYLPAVAVCLTIDLGLLLLGMVLPYWAVIGGMVAVLSTFLLNPLLYKMGMLPHWNPTMDTPKTNLSNYIDFFMSWNIGLSFAIAIIGFWGMFAALRKARGSGEMDFKKLLINNKERGDISIWVSLGIYVFSTTTFILICKWLVPTFPTIFFILYGFVFTPIISYATARMEGIAGQVVNIPFVKEAGFIIASRWDTYRGIDIWFAPIPVQNYGVATVGFRQIELTGTRLKSIIKTEIMVVPIIFGCSILFSQFIWGLAPVPSDAYPYTQVMWDQHARQQLLQMTSTTGGESPFFDALKPEIMAGGLSLGLVLYAVLSMFSLPTLFIYGVVRGFGQASPQHILLEFVGALLGRYYFEKRFGREKWRQYAPVVLAGYACGVGLVSAFSIGISMIAKSISQMSY
jgi:hypothetical protein